MLGDGCVFSTLAGNSWFPTITPYIYIDMMGPQTLVTPSQLPKNYHAQSTLGLEIFPCVSPFIPIFGG